MTLRVADRVFAPRAWAVLLTVLLVAAFVALGGWQLGRRDEKQAMIDAFAHGAGSSTVPGDGTMDDLPRFQHVKVAGRYDPARQVLLDNMPSSRTGRPGYRVLTPLVRDGTARLLLVDRGWVPLGATRADLPEVVVPAAARQVGGRLDRLPVPGVRVGDAGVKGDAAWPRVLNFPKRLDLERVLGTPVEERILLLDATEPDGFEREWRPALSVGPERHLGYAIQWFALAVVLLVIFVALSFEHRPSRAGLKASRSPP